MELETDTVVFSSRKLPVESRDDKIQDASSSAVNTSLPVTLLSPHCDSHMAKIFTTGETVTFVNFITSFNVWLV